MTIVRIVFGVLLPVVALLVEMTTHFCAQAFFDPLPSIWHALLVAFVAIGNWLVISALAKPDYQPRAREAILTGAVIAVSLVYTARFLPILPMSVIAFMFMGLGVLSFAPLLALIAALLLAVQLSSPKKMLAKIQRNKISQQMMAGFLIGFLSLMLAEMPVTLTKLALEHAASSNPHDSRTGVLMLRSFGNKNELLRLCYSDSSFGSMKGSMTDVYDRLFGYHKAVDPGVVRNIFDRVTGTAFNQYEKPSSGWSSWTDDIGGNFDPEIAGEVVGGRVPNLSLDSSEIQATCNPNGAVADVSWTMTFKNTAEWGDAEARTKIALPPGAVVSDLTLWINGKPQPAAFGSRSTVRSAYQSVVRSMRDPVLVTTAGTDRILMQCFPIRPNGGLLKTKLQLAIPLALDQDKASLALPQLVENNFNVTCATKTSIQSTTPTISAPESLLKSGPNVLNGVIGQRQLFQQMQPIVFKRNGLTDANSHLYSVDNKGTLVEQKLEERTVPPAKNVVVVVDGSIHMKDYAGQVAAALKSIPAKLPWSVVLAADEVSALTPQDKLYQELTPAKVADVLTRLRFDGGPDNLQALKWASVLAQSKPDSTIVWIHGSQPIFLEEPDTIFPSDQKRPTEIYSIEVEPGSNVITEKLSDRLNFRTVWRKGTVEQDLKGLFQNLIYGKRALVPVRMELDKSMLQSRGGTLTPGNAVVKLWASGQVDKLLKEGQALKATNLAIRTRVVTPVSGAVVLESKGDYVREGLADPKSNDIPSAPEPEMWILIAIIGSCLAFQMKTRIRSLIAWRS